MFQRITGRAVTKAWLECIPPVRKILSRSDNRLDAGIILHALLSEQYQLWMDPERVPPAFALTTLYVDNEIKTLGVLLIGGERVRDWVEDVERTISEFGLAQGAVALEAHVRPGLIGAKYSETRAVLKGWVPRWTVVRKSLI